MTPITIRPYTPADYTSISRIHDAARKIELSLARLDDAFLPFFVAAEREDFFDYPHIDVAELNDQVVGFCAYTEEELAWLYVSPDLHRQKIGSALVRAALRRAGRAYALQHALMAGQYNAPALVPAAHVQRQPVHRRIGHHGHARHNGPQAAQLRALP